MALANMGFKDKKLVSFWEREENVKEEEEEEEKQRKRRSSKPRYGTLDFCMETNLDYGFYEIWYGSLVLYGYYLASNLGF